MIMLLQLIKLIFVFLSCLLLSVFRQITKSGAVDIFLRTTYNNNMTMSEQHEQIIHDIADYWYIATDFLLISCRNGQEKKKPVVKTGAVTGNVNLSLIIDTKNSLVCSHPVIVRNLCKLAVFRQFF